VNKTRPGPADKWACCLNQTPGSALWCA